MIAKAKPLKRDKLKTSILNMMLKANMKAGDRLISERKLSEMFGVTHITVRAALAELAKDGILDRVAGSGTFFTGRTEADNQANSAVSTRIVAASLRNKEEIFNEIYNHIAQELQTRKYVLNNYYVKADTPEEHMERQQQIWGLDGVRLLVMQTEIEKTPELIADFNKNAPGFKSVVRVLGNGCCEAKLYGHLVTLDYRKATEKIVSEMIKAGHRKIAYLGAPVADNYINASANRRHVAIYTDAMLKFGLADHIRVKTLPPGQNSREWKEAAKTLLAVPERPTAVVCGTDYFAALACDAARELGLSVPKDISVAGGFNTEWAEHYQLDSFIVPFQSLAEEVVSLLLSDSKDFQEKILPMKYISRGSIQKAK